MGKGSSVRWMWLEAFETLNRAERLQRQFFELVLTRSPGPVWEPPVDVFEGEKGLCVVVALPGVVPDSVVARLNAGTLLVSGMRPGSRERRTAKIHRLEIPYGRFERVITLPPGKYTIDNRSLVDGCLTVSLRKVHSSEG